MKEGEERELAFKPAFYDDKCFRKERSPAYRCECLNATRRFRGYRQVQVKGAPVKEAAEETGKRCW